MKKCSKCNIEKELKFFSKDSKSKDSLSYHCKECVKSYQILNKDKIKQTHDICLSKNKDVIKKRQKKYNQINKEFIQIKTKNYRVKNKEIIQEKEKLYWDKNKIKKQQKDKRYKEKNKARRNTLEKEKRLNDSLYKLKTNIRTLIAKKIKNSGFKKNSRTEKILGCSFADFKKHLENKFEAWMNWENHGKYTGKYNETWNIDHLIPISLAKTQGEIYKLNHFSNLQPLCSKKNQDKKDKLNYK